MIFNHGFFLVILASFTTGEILLSDTSFPDANSPEVRQFFVRLPGLVRPPPAPVPAPVPAPYVAPPQPVPILSPAPALAISSPVNVPGITRVPGSAPSTLKPCSPKCCRRYCKVAFCDSSTAAKKIYECGNSTSPIVADKCYNPDADGCLPKQCSMPTSCKNPCSTVISIITNVAFCDP